MGEFIEVAFGFPTALFSFSLVVVAGYWAMVLLGALGTEVLDADVDTGADIGMGDGGTGGLGGLLAASGLGGVPATVVLSSLIVVAWFVSLVGSVLLGGLVGEPAGGPAVLLVALGAAWWCTRLSVVPLRRVFRSDVGASLRDFVGLTCVIRTGRVGPDFGQAEVTAPDGSSAIVQVRRPESDVPVAGARAAGGALTAGSTALIFDYDPRGAFFWVMPYDAAAITDGL
ncbi:hypothetical protein [Spirillospora sp. CA-294931]|uniref:hypothetical protein n=1 Tax=Spirillospora sp. CA-294931 TaxID=3240042 RepID=UPI003D8DB4EF